MLPELVVLLLGFCTGVLSLGALEKASGRESETVNVLMVFAALVLVMVLGSLL